MRTRFGNQALLVASICALGLMVSPIHAGLIEYWTTAGTPGASPDANNNLTSGTGTIWTDNHFVKGDFGDGYNGVGTYNSGNNGGGSGAGAGNPAWQMWAGKGGSVDIGHHFVNGALTVGSSLSLQFDNGYVWQDSNPSYNGDVGIRLSGSSGWILSMSFSGGDSKYRYYDQSVSGGDTGLGYTADGFTFAYTQTGANAYSASITKGATTYTWTGTASSAPNFIQVYDKNGAGWDNNGANYDLFVNNFQINAVPEPVTMALALFGGVAGVGSFWRWRKNLQTA